MSVISGINPKRQKLLDMFDGCCAYCHTELTRGNISFDHLLPQVLGGKRTHNLVPACKPCNLLKGSHFDIGEFDEYVVKVRAILFKTHKLIEKMKKKPERPVIVPTILPKRKVRAAKRWVNKVQHKNKRKEIPMDWDEVARRKALYASTEDGKH